MKIETKLDSALPKESEFIDRRTSNEQYLDQVKTSGENFFNKATADQKLHSPEFLELVNDDQNDLFSFKDQFTASWKL